MPPDNSFRLNPDALFEYELRVARRADELVGKSGSRGLDLHCWLLAERDVFGGISDGRNSSLHRDVRMNIRQPSDE
jgi:hypothetical protein